MVIIKLRSFLSVKSNMILWRNRSYQQKNIFLSLQKEKSPFEQKGQKDFFIDF